MLRWMQIAVLVVALTASASVAWADLMPIGDPLDVGSWAQGFNESGVGNFNLVAVKMDTYPEDKFKSPTHSSFSASGWNVWYERDDAFNPSATPMYATAVGPAVTSLTWNIQFNDLRTDPLAFDFVAFYNNTRLESAHAVWSGSGWTITAGSWLPTRAEINAIPAPGAIALGMMGLGLVGWLKRRVG